MLVLYSFRFLICMANQPRVPDDQRDTQSQGLKILKECPMCEHSFQSTDVRVVNTYRNVHLLHLTCQSCAHAILSLFAISQTGMSSVGMATDLSAGDATRLLDTEPIGEDEVLLFHTLLSKQGNAHGAFEHLFINEKRSV